MESVKCSIESDVDWVEARDNLRQWRENNSRKSSRIIKLGSFLLKHRRKDLGNEGSYIDSFIVVGLEK